MSYAEQFLRLAELEKRYASELIELANSIKHPVLSALFYSVAKDSEKHALMYESLVRLMKHEEPFISEEDFKAISTVIHKHIETEMKMLEESAKLLSEIGDPRAKLILAAIMDDEARHHKLLLSIKKNIAEESTLTEEIFWNMVWRDSPWHGAPGG